MHTPLSKECISSIFFNTLPCISSNVLKQSVSSFFLACHEQQHSPPVAHDRHVGAPRRVGTQRHRGVSRVVVLHVAQRAESPGMLGDEDCLSSYFLGVPWLCCLPLLSNAWRQGFLCERWDTIESCSWGRAITKGLLERNLEVSLEVTLRAHSRGDIVEMLGDEHSNSLFS